MNVERRLSYYDRQVVRWNELCAEPLSLARQIELESLERELDVLDGGRGGRWRKRAPQPSVRLVYMWMET